MPTISGVTRDEAGSPLGGATVLVFDAANNTLAASGTSGPQGNYSLTVAGAGPFWATSHKAGTTFLAGTTRRDLTAVADSSTAAAPGAPTIGNPVAGNGFVDVYFTAPTSDGGSAILDYTATLSTGQTATGTSSPVRVTAPNDTAVTATVKARNAIGAGPASAASTSVTPVAGTSAAVLNLWTGTPMADGVVLTAKLKTTGTANSTRVAVSTSSDLSNPTFSAIVAPDATYRIAKYIVTGCAPNTVYYYGIEVDGVIDTATKGRFKTVPTGAASFSVVVGSCASNTDQTAFAAINAIVPKPLAVLFMGDFAYSNNGTANEADKHPTYDAPLGNPIRHQMHREIPSPHTWSDHDFGPSDSTGLDGANVPEIYRQPSLDAFRRRVPVIPASSDPTDTIDYSFVIGRVRFIFSDLRSSKSDQYAPAEIKQMMGAAQKQRWKNEISAAASAGQFVAWISDVPWHTGTPGAESTVADDWGGYTTERTELADHIKACGMGGKVCVLAGDMHALAISSGIDYATGGGAMTPVFQAGPFHQTASSKGGPYLYGPVGTGSPTQYGVMDVADDGTNMTIYWAGFDAATGTELMAYDFTPFGTRIADPSKTIPGPMAAPVATADVVSAEVTLTPPSDIGGSPILGYTIVSNPPGGIDAQAGTTALVRTITNLPANVSHTFTATSRNKTGTSLPSPASNAVVPTPAETVPAGVFNATGGTITEPGDGYRYWTFDTIGTDTLNVTSAGPVERLVVGGGGGGSSSNSTSGGGGGAGEANLGTMTIEAGAHSITVGDGGAGGTTALGQPGLASSIGSLVTALGGGNGSSASVGTNGASGGGGGAGSGATAPGAGTAGKGNPGGVGYPSATATERSAGGGGGAGSKGQDGVINKGGKGGDGVTVWGKEYAGGGGGASGAATDSGGLGSARGGRGFGGGNPTSAEANSGSGGGGSRANVAAGKGGSGVVILRRPV